MNVEKIMEQLTNLVVDYGPKLVGAIVVWIIGSWVIKALVRGVTKVMDKRQVDESLKPFLRSLIGVVLKAMLIISVLSMLGIEMTSFIAILGAAGLAVGMALSGTLQNFAGGVMILLFKPFKVGDYIAAQGHEGLVHEIQIFNTILKSLDNKVIIIPNGGLSTSSMVNYTAESTRRVDWTFGIAYGDSVDKAFEVLLKLCEADSRILREPDYSVSLSSLGDSSVNIACRAWVKTEDYWGVFLDMNKNVYDTFEKEGLSIPFPQMDVHLHKKQQS